MTAHTDVGAYSMGLLEERDRREFEDHLAGCAACAAEVAELSPMAALLRGVEPASAAGSEPAAGRELAAGPEPGGGDVTELLQLLDDLLAARIGQHQVEDHEQWGLLLRGVERLLAGVGQDHPVTCLLEVEPDNAGDLPVVLDDEHRTYHGITTPHSVAEVMR